MSAGAYGAAMASEYNSRPLVPEVLVKGDRYAAVARYEDGQPAFDLQGFREVDGTGKVAMPGFVDAHVHVESSMLVPSEFARAAVVQVLALTLSRHNRTPTPGGRA